MASQPVWSGEGKVILASRKEPLLYCASDCTNSAWIPGLKREFPQYEAMTQIWNPENFALQLGIDFARGVDVRRTHKLSPLDDAIYAQSRYTVDLWEGVHSIDTVIHVYHGPVHYTDEVARVRQQEDLVAFGIGPSVWFTKKLGFARQREYRFAISTFGKPKKETLCLPVSAQLRKLISTM